MIDPQEIRCSIDDREVDCETWGEETLLNKSFDGNLIPEPHMSEDDRAQMFLDECLHNADIIDQSPFTK